MKEIGFNKNYYEETEHEEYSPFWCFSRTIRFPKGKRWKNIEIGFDVEISKDGSNINIMVFEDMLPVVQWHKIDISLLLY